jgi:hypothetical protein
VLLGEQLLSLSQAARRIPAYRGSRGCNPSTIFRWITNGIKLPDGRLLRMEALRLANRWITSVEAVDRFLIVQHESFAPRADLHTHAPARTPAQRQRAAQQAAARLEDLGI